MLKTIVAILIIAFIIGGIILLKIPQTNGQIELGNEVVETSTTTDKGTTYTLTDTYKGVEIAANVDSIGYYQCKAGQFGTSTDAFCDEKLEEQKALNLQWAKESVDGQKAMEALLEFGKNLK